LRVAVLHNYRDEQQPSMRLYAERLGEALRRREVHVTRVRPPGVVPKAWRVRSAAWNKIDGYVGRFAVYPRLVRTLDVDVTHIADHGQGYLVASLDARRTIVTCHDVILLALAAGRIGAVRVPQIALQLFRFSVEIMKRAAVVVADSVQTKLDLVRFVGMDPDKVMVIHPGLNQRFAPDQLRGSALRQRFGIGSGAVLLQIGRGFYKNLPGVLRVLSRLRKGGLDVRVARVGPALAGSDRALAETLGVVDSIVELGMVSDSDLPALYNAVDLLLFPSLYEGFGWPPLEAMASGTPVVCSRAGSLDEVVGDAALTADPEDVEALAWHVAAALSDRGLKSALIERGLAHAARFNWDQTAEQMIGLYRDVIARAS
jgi:glycosyltransferase involved in cell wall biosynthesis